MRRDEADEADRAGADDGDGGQHRAGDEEERAPGFKLEAHRARPKLARGQDIQRARDDNREHRGEDRSAQTCTRRQRPTQVACEPEHHAAHLHRGRNRQEHAHERTAGACHHHTGQEKSRRSAAPREEVDEANR